MRIIDSHGRIQRKTAREARFLGTKTRDQVFDIAKELYDEVDFDGMRMGKACGDNIDTFGAHGLAEYMRKNKMRPGSTVLYMVTDTSVLPSTSRKRKDSTTEGSSSEQDVPVTSHPTKDVQKIPEQEITRLTQIGQGSQATVYKGEWHGNKVALKVCEVVVSSEKIKKEIMDEAAVHYGLRHPNVIYLYGICTTASSVTLVSELMNTSLAQMMDEKETEEMTRHQKLLMLKQIASGLTYLHTNNIVHGDIKPLNILLNDDRSVVKLCDFGLSRFKSDLKGTRTGTFRGTDMYLSPELLIKGRDTTKASDVWALGATTVELFADEDFWQIPENTPSFILEVSKLMQKKKTPPGLRDLEEKDIDVYNIAALCVAYKIQDRPTSRDIFQHVKQVLGETQ